MIPIQEFSDTMKYIASIRAEVEQYGICRIVPPHSWQPPCLLKDSEKKSVRLPTRVQQLDKLQVRKAQVKEKERQGRQNRELRRDSTEALLVREDDNDAASSDEEGKFGFEPGPAFTLNAFEKYAHQFKEEYFGLKDVCNDSVLNQKLSIECIEGEYWRIVEHPTEQLEVVSGITHIFIAVRNIYSELYFMFRSCMEQILRQEYSVVASQESWKE